MHINMNDDLNRLWKECFAKTPWLNADVIGRLYERFSATYNYLHSKTAKLSATLSGKARSFDSMKKYFLICEDELIILAENEDSIQNLIDAMKLSQGKCVFFIMTQKFLKKNFPFDLLSKESFALDKDFVRGWEILSSAQGYPLGSGSLIDAM